MSVPGTSEQKKLTSETKASLPMAALIAGFSPLMTTVLLDAKSTVNVNDSKQVAEEMGWLADYFKSFDFDRLANTGNYYTNWFTALVPLLSLDLPSLVSRVEKFLSQKTSENDTNAVRDSIRRLINQTLVQFFMEDIHIPPELVPLLKKLLQDPFYKLNAQVVLLKLGVDVTPETIKWAMDFVTERPRYDYDEYYLRYKFILKFLCRLKPVSPKVIETCLNHLCDNRRSYYDHELSSWMMDAIVNFNQDFKSDVFEKDSFKLNRLWEIAEQNTGLSKKGITTHNRLVAIQKGVINLLVKIYLSNPSREDGLTKIVAILLDKITKSFDKDYFDLLVKIGLELENPQLEKFVDQIKKQLAEKNLKLTVMEILLRLNKANRITLEEKNLQQEALKHVTKLPFDKLFHKLESPDFTDNQCYGDLADLKPEIPNLACFSEMITFYDPAKIVNKIERLVSLLEKRRILQSNDQPWQDACETLWRILGSLLAQIQQGNSNDLLKLLPQLLKIIPISSQSKELRQVCSQVLISLIPLQKPDENISQEGIQIIGFVAHCLRRDNSPNPVVAAECLMAVTRMNSGVTVRLDFILDILKTCLDFPVKKSQWEDFLSSAISLENFAQFFLHLLRMDAVNQESIYKQIIVFMKVAYEDIIKFYTPQTDVQLRNWFAIMIQFMPIEKEIQSNRLIDKNIQETLAAVLPTGVIRMVLGYR